ncbi:hypothetical protein Pmi06nite_78150 [Planotetraspora mira]|uniref:Uncharacterized protein n=1 Tax=Planotetraspora mira TaxID=58121 RepID=A0A8J3TWF7_9ACTN|nr:hypothetical protein Pmi06nite_78150 [Planotetraspora mira]
MPSTLSFRPCPGNHRKAATQVDYTTLGTGYVQEAHERFQRWQEEIHGGEQPPSERVIEDERAISGEEYRLQAEGPHPLPSLRQH